MEAEIQRIPMGIDSKRMESCRKILSLDNVKLLTWVHLSEVFVGLFVFGFDVAKEIRKDCNCLVN